MTFTVCLQSSWHFLCQDSPHLECYIFFSCRVFEKEGVKLIVDNISYDFVKGATVDYAEELIRSAFLVRYIFYNIPLIPILIHCILTSLAVLVRYLFFVQT